MLNKKSGSILFLAAISLASISAYAAPADLENSGQKNYRQNVGAFSLSDDELMAVLSLRKKAMPLAVRSTIQDEKNGTSESESLKNGASKIDRYKESIVAKDTRQIIIDSKKNSTQYAFESLIQMGEMDKKIKRLNGHRSKQNVLLALRTIVPDGWSGFALDNGVKDSSPVTWSAKDKEWTEVLDSVLLTNNLRAVVHWDKKEIEFMSIDYYQSHIGDFVLDNASGKEKNKISNVAEVKEKQHSDGGLEVDFAREMELIEKALNNPKQSQAINPTEKSAKVSGNPSAELLEQAESIKKNEEEIRKMGLTSEVPDEAKKEIKKYKNIDFSGNPVDDSISVKSAGYNIPVMSALSEISPKGWLVYSKDKGVSSIAMTGWRGGNRKWLEVLSEFLTANKLAAKIKYGSKEIEIVRI